MEDRHVNALLVDDDEVVLAFLVEVLASDPRLNWSVHRSSSPALALKIAAEHMAELDMVMTDFDMPGMNGIQLADKLRSGGFMGPIVLITAGGGKSGPIPVDVDAHVSRVLLKPFRTQAFLELLYEVLHV